MEELKTLGTIAVALFGVFLTHRFTSKRDVENSQRTVRIGALTEAYKALIRSGLEKELLPKDENGKVINKAIPVENAIAIIHLHGSELQSRLATQYANDFAANRGADCTALVNSIRDDIRKSLDYEKLEAEPAYLVVIPGANKPSQRDTNT